MGSALSESKNHESPCAHACGAQCAQGGCFVTTEKVCHTDDPCLTNVALATQCNSCSCRTEDPCLNNVADFWKCDGWNTSIDQRYQPVYVESNNYGEYHPQRMASSSAFPAPPSLPVLSTKDPVLEKLCLDPENRLQRALRLDAGSSSSQLSSGERAEAENPKGYWDKRREERDLDFRMQSMLDETRQMERDHLVNSQFSSDDVVDHQIKHNIDSTEPLHWTHRQYHEYNDKDGAWNGETSYQRWRRHNDQYLKKERKKKSFWAVEPEADDIKMGTPPPRRQVISDSHIHESEHLPNYGLHPEAEKVWNRHLPQQPQQGDLEEEDTSRPAAPRQWHLHS